MAAILYANSRGIIVVEAGGNGEENLDDEIYDRNPGPPHGPHTGAVPPLPREKQMTTHPPYVVEPPDILLISAVRLIPRPPYRIEPLDVLTLQVTETLPNQPIVGLYPVQPDGTIALGFTYGVVRIAGLTLEEAQRAIREHLERRLKAPQVALGLAQFLSEYGSSWNLLMAAAVLATLPVLLVFVLMQRGFMQGFSGLAGLKG